MSINNFNADSSLEKTRRPAHHRLSTDTAIELVLLGALLVGMSLAAKYLIPNYRNLTFGTGLVGGVFCILWGSIGRKLLPGRLLAMITVILIGVVFVRQGILSWQASAQNVSSDRIMLALMVVYVVYCLGTLVRLACEHKNPPS
jgi:hypothetical protein